jgi:hypothetical protein
MAEEPKEGSYDWAMQAMRDPQHAEKLYGPKLDGEGGDAAFKAKIEAGLRSKQTPEERARFDQEYGPSSKGESTFKESVARENGPVIEPQRKQADEENMMTMESVFNAPRHSQEFDNAFNDFASWYDESAKTVPNFDRLVEYGEQVLGPQAVLEIAHMLSQKWKENR